MTLAPDSMVSISIASAYTSIIFLMATMLVGPVSTIKSKASPLSSYLRRDLGIWTGIFALTHFYTSLEIDFGPDTSWTYLFVAEDPDALIPIRLDLLGLANHLGLIAIVIFSVLLVISSDRVLQALKPARWKRIQKWAYVAAGLTFIHGAMYQLISNRSTVYVVSFIIIFTDIAAGQAWGFRERRRRLNRGAAKAAD